MKEGSSGGAKRHLTLRPRSSLRKGRSETIDHVARRPLQDRSLKRFELILGAAETLLKSANIEDISLYDIAAQASLSPASVHYLFPTVAALRIELSKRYNLQASQQVVIAQRALASARTLAWQAWIRILVERTRDLFNRNRHICEVLLGPLLHRESRHANINGNDMVARSLLENLRHVYIVPDIPRLEHRLSLTCEITDAIFSRSYILNGCIDDEALEDVVEAKLALLRAVLPETLVPRDRQAKRGAWARHDGLSDHSPTRIERRRKAVRAEATSAR